MHVHSCAQAQAGGRGRDALEEEGPGRRSQRRLGRRLEEVAEAVGGGYCRLQMPSKLTWRQGTVAGHRLGALEGRTSPPFQYIPLPRGLGGSGAHGGESCLRVRPSSPPPPVLRPSVGLARPIDVPLFRSRPSYKSS